MDNGSRTLRSVRPAEPVRLPREPKKKPVFWWIFGTVFVLLLAVLAVALVILYRFLAAYETSQPIHEAQALFDRVFTGEDYAEAIRLSGFEPGPFEDVSVVNDSLKEWGEGKDLVFYQVRSEEGKARYNVIFADPVKDETDADGALSHRSASMKIATMTFRQTDEKDLGFGFKGWEYESLELELAGNGSVTVTVPRGSALTVNGREVPETCLVSSEDSPYNAFLPEGVSGIVWDKYRVEGLFHPAEVACVDKDGVAMTLAEEEDGAVTAQLNYREDLQQSYADFVRQGMEAYAAFIQADGGIAAVRKYFDTNSLFYRNTARNPQQWVIDHNGYHFENESVTQFYAYDENTISCKVDMVQVLTKSRSEDYRDHMVMTVFLRKVNGNFRIYDRMTEI